ncbi:putative aureobasidin-resistance protein [Stachybotrys elegans]|uniref:Aureobasidin-resistance protein n=1 Tax=Stachybotrys elegans TaxID=80388 RepID=A0A8K0SWK9_9HYPO|nr:putative aureobasidin-resistance protein [Stachybotrys elegans]
MDELPAPYTGKTALPTQWTDRFSLAVFTRLSNNRTPTPERKRRGSNSKSKIILPGMHAVSDLKTSFDFRDGVRDLQKHRWTLWDIQYAVLIGLSLFSLSIAPSAPLLKTSAVFATTWIMLMPATRQILLPSSPIWVWLLYFFCSRFIPYEVRPHIWVRVLPALENVLYGANISNILSAHQHPILDILAWIPYGLTHFGAPLVCSIIFFIFGAPGTMPVFARTFGWMSILGVTIQLFFPCTPPWFENENGLIPAVYGMHGSPAGLARVDKILGFDMYTTNFTNAPLPFGAFPSLHAANAVLEALFMTHCFPQFRTLWIVYAGWVWWATMYLSHHYAIDLVAGGLIAAAAYYYSRTYWLPRRQADKTMRWDYEYVEIGDRDTIPDEEESSYFGLGLIEPRSAGSMDGWTLSSRSSSASGMMSPAVSDDAFSSTASV